MSVPSDIESYLTPDEKMVKIGRSRRLEIYITDKRVILKKGGIFGKEIIEASYRHISSIEYKKHTAWDDIIGGAVMIALAFFVDDIINVVYPLSRSQRPIVEQIFTILFVVLGLISIVVGVLMSSARYTIHVVGRKPIPLSVKGLEDAIKIIRQYREKVEAEITK